MSDPVINGDLPAKQFHLNEQTTWAVAFYTAYGLYTSINGAIATCGRHRRALKRRLAARAASTFVPGMDWDAEGLLEGLEDDAARARAARLLDELHEQGAAVEELTRLVAEDKLVLAPVSRLLSSEERYTAREISERSGVELEMLAASWRALGLPVPGPTSACSASTTSRRPGSARCTARRASPTRTRSRSRACSARAWRATPRPPARSSRARSWSPGSTSMSSRTATRRSPSGCSRSPARGCSTSTPPHLQQVLRTDAVTQEQRRTGSHGDTRQAVVAFADLVGFTELGESVPVEELGSVAGRLSHLAAEACDPPVRIVKLIGDAVMLVAAEPAPMLDCALRLVEAAEADDALPPLRAGIASGQAVHRWGDWFGTPVNLASRLTTRARPSTVLVTQEVRDAVAGNGFEFSDAGRKRLKGFSSPVHAFRARRS